MKALYVVGLTIALLAPAGASAQDKTWATWDDMVKEALSVPHTETKTCQGRSTCTITIVVEVGGHKEIIKRVIGPGVDKKLMCMDEKPCIPW